MTSPLVSVSSSVILLAVVGVSAWAQDTVSSSDGRHLNPLDDLKLSDVRSFVERPLFAPSRRPTTVPEAADIEIEKPAESAPEFVLLGVTSGPEGSVARIAMADGKEAHSLRKGESVEGWTVQSIESSSVTMAQADKITVLTIFREAGEPSDDGETAESTPGIVFGAEEPAEADDPPRKVRVVAPQ